MNYEVKILKIVETEHIIGDSHYFVALKPAADEDFADVAYDGKKYVLITAADGSVYCSKVFSTINNVFSNMHDNAVIAIAEIVLFKKQQTKIFVMADAQ